VSNWTEITDPDVLRLRFHSRFVPPAGSNRGGYADREVDQWIDRGARTLAAGTRAEIYGRVQRRLAEDLPYVPLWHRDVVAVYRDRVRGFRLTPGADFDTLQAVRLEPQR